MLGVFTLLCLPQFEEFLSMSSMLFLAFPCGFPPLFLPGELGYMPVRQWKTSLPFYCVLSIELLRSASSSCLFWPHGAEVTHRLWEWGGAWRRPEAGSPKTWCNVRAFFRVSTISRISPLFPCSVYTSLHSSCPSPMLLYFLLFVSWKGLHLILHCVSFLREAGMRDRCEAGTPHWWHTD